MLGAPFDGRNVRALRPPLQVGGHGGCVSGVGQWFARQVHRKADDRTDLLRAAKRRGLNIVLNHGDDTDPPENPNPSEPSDFGGTPLFPANERIAMINGAEEIKGSFLDYSKSVIISRAPARRARRIEAFATALSVRDAGPLAVSQPAAS